MDKTKLVLSPFLSLASYMTVTNLEPQFLLCKMKVSHARSSQPLTSGDFNMTVKTFIIRVTGAQSWRELVYSFIGQPFNECVLM